MNTEYLERVKDYFYNLHDVECNQKYNKGQYPVPYSFHLEMVGKQADKFIHLISNEINYKDTVSYTDRELVYIGVYGHDSIEDARLTFNDIKQNFNIYAAEIILACTERWGHNRNERHSQEYFNYLKQNKLAVFVKLCDIIANVKFSLLTNSSMFKKYKNEFPQLKQELYCIEYNEMFDYLENILNIN